MPCITVPIEPEMKRRMERFPWVKWSEIGIEEMMRRDIFDRYARTRKLSAEDEKFCEEKDWHPVDELPLKDGYKKKLRDIQKGKHRKTSLEELDELMGLK